MTSQETIQTPRQSSVYRFFQAALFPTFLFGTPAAMYALIEAGVSIPIATYACILVLGMLYLLAEYLMPYRREWNKQQGDLSNDVISGTIAYGILPVFLKPIYVALLAGATAWIASQTGGSVWPSDWPITAQLVLLLLAGDAGRYWGHRLAHEVPFLWRFHAVHHSAKRLWFFNAFRQHPIDKAWFTFTELFFPILLGADGVVLSLYLGVTAVCGFAQHCNIDLKLGPFYWFFNVVDLHRWHHSKDVAESDNNYGNNLIVYDRLFGTYYHPEHQQKTTWQVGDIGLLNPNYPQHYLGQLVAPFQGDIDKVDPAEKASKAGKSV